jgi:hypothetical protein
MDFRTHNDEPTMQHDWPSMLQSTIQASLAELAFAFGAPVSRPGPSVTTEWLIRFEDQAVASVYDWKDPARYATTEPRSWHVASRTREVAERVHEAFRDAMTKLKDTNRRAA